MAGRPAAYESAEALDLMIEGYFEYLKGKKVKVTGENGKEVEEWERYPEPATITGLALWLGFESRQSFYDYEKNEQFSYTIKKARLRVENEYEKALRAQSPTGAIFALKNLGWKDKTEQDITTAGERINTIQVEVIRNEAKSSN